MSATNASAFRLRAFERDWVRPLLEIVDEGIGALLVEEARRWVVLGQRVGYFAGLPSNIGWPPMDDALIASVLGSPDAELDIATFGECLAQAQDDLTPQRLDYLTLVLMADDETWARRIDEAERSFDEISHRRSWAFSPGQADGISWILTGALSSIAPVQGLPSYWRSSDLAVLERCRGTRLRRVAGTRSRLVSQLMDEFGWLPVDLVGVAEASAGFLLPAPGQPHERQAAVDRVQGELPLGRLENPGDGVRDGGVTEFADPKTRLRRLLVVGPDRVQLFDGAVVLAEKPVALAPATLDAVSELHRLWRHGVLPNDRQGAIDGALADVGRRLSSDFVAGEVGAVLAATVAQAVRSGETLELGVQAPSLAALPWEALQLTEPDGTVPPLGGTPLALHRHVALYRSVAGGGTPPRPPSPGPLRILAVVASPDSDSAGGELLNYEQELRRLLSVIDPPRKSGHAYVRVLAEGSLSAIRSALLSDPQAFHVLHLSCHAAPGALLMERDDGSTDLVSAARLLEEGVPPRIYLPMIVLSACSTGVAGPSYRDDPTERAIGGVAQELLQAGVPVVLATQAAISDVYATELTTRVYEHLANADVPDPLAALSTARRAVEADRQRLPADARRRGPAEWATPSLWVREPRVPLYSSGHARNAVTASYVPPLATGVVRRGVGEFIGRRRELRWTRRARSAGKAGVVIHGIGGVGKSALAAELLAGTAGDCVVVSLSGAVSIDRIFSEISAELQQAVPGDHELRHPHDVAALLRADDLHWTDRWRVFAERVLPVMPVLVLLDDFDANLDSVDGAWGVQDAELADLLSRWAARHGRSMLVITSRYPFVLPGGAQHRLDHLHLGPLSPAETRKLIWRLPGLDALSAEDLTRAYRDVGGHPRALEYLDALLRAGRARFKDVVDRMEERLGQRGIADPATWMATRDRDLDSTVAEAVTLAGDDILLSGLLELVATTPLAHELIIGASVYRVPVDRTGLAWQIVDETDRLSDPDRDSRIKGFEETLAEATADLSLPIEPGEHGLTPADVAGHQADGASARRPPVVEPRGFDHAVSVAMSVGLLAPVAMSDGSTMFTVHRWTAAAIAKLQPAPIERAHRRAARYWRWRGDSLPQHEHYALEEILEARHHHYAGDEQEAALELSEHAILQLQRWGRYGVATELCRETLSWVPPGTGEAAAYLHHLGILAQAQGDYATAEQRYLEALDIGERLGHQIGVASERHQLGILAQLRGDYATAEQHLIQSLEITDRLEEGTGFASSCHELGVLAQLRGDYDTAEHRYSQSLRIFEELHNDAGVATVYHQLGNLSYVRGSYDSAEERYTQSLQISERHGNLVGVASSYQQLGAIAQARGDHDAAEVRYLQSLEISERIGDQAGIADIFHQLGSLRHSRGDYERAEYRYRQSLELSERLGDMSGVANAYHQLGILAQVRGDYADAEQSYERSLAMNDAIGDLRGVASAHHQLGLLAQDRGDYSGAEQRYLRALELDRGLRNERGIATTTAQLGAVAQLQGHYDLAEEHYRNALSISERLGDRAGVAAIYGRLGGLAQRRRDYAGAEARYEQALEINGQLNHQTGVATIYRELGGLAEETGDYDRAQQNYQQSIEISEVVGDVVALASGYSACAMVMSQRGNVADAVEYEIAALFVRMQMRSRQAHASVERLVALRSRLGADAFVAIARRRVDAQSMLVLVGLLDAHPMRSSGHG